MSDDINELLDTSSEEAGRGEVEVGEALQEPVEGKEDVGKLCWVENATGGNASIGEGLLEEGMGGDGFHAA